MPVLFTHGYFIHDDPKEQAIMRPYPPLGVLYLAAWLEKNGMPCEVFDTTFSTKELLEKHLLQTRPAVVAIYTNLMTKLNVIWLMRLIKNREELKHSVVVLGGPDVSYNVENYLAAGADVIVIGEGEETMLDIARAVDQGNRQEFGHIPGLAYKTAEGLVVRTEARKKMRDIDELPRPAREKINLGLYLEAWKNRHGLSAVSVSTQRGCPYTCRWCSTAVYGQSYRRRSPQNVADEMEYLRDRYQADTIWFVDDVFTVSHKWLMGLKDELQARNIKIPFECITRADRLNEDILATLGEMGCFRVWIGAESGSQKIIDAMDRRVDVNQVRNMIRASKKYGIQSGTFIMLGYPGETEEDIKETVRHLKSSDPDLFTITVAYPIKGTGLYEEVEGLRTTHLPWEESTDRDIDFKRTYPRKYYDYAVRWVVNEVNRNKIRRNISIKSINLGLKSAFARFGMIFYRTGAKFFFK